MDAFSLRNGLTFTSALQRSCKRCLGPLAVGQMQVRLFHFGFTQPFACVVMRGWLETVLSACSSSSFSSSFSGSSSSLALPSGFVLPLSFLHCSCAVQALGACGAVVRHCAVVYGRQGSAGCMQAAPHWRAVCREHWRHCHGVGDVWPW